MIRSWAARVFGLAIFLVWPVLTLAAPRAADPCDPSITGTRIVPPLTAPALDLGRDVAIEITTHVQRACRLLGRLAHDNLDGKHRAVADRIAVVADKLRIGILHSIYRTYPDLRGQDFTSSPASPPDRKSPNRKMGAVTAVHLRWALADAEYVWPVEFTDKDCGATPAKICHDGFQNVTAEIGFAGWPAQRDYPDLWRLTSNELEKRNAKGRTRESDAAFRKNVPAKGSVKLTPAAFSQIRDLLSSLRREVRARCQVPSLTWMLGGSSKGPDDADWKKIGPGVSLGAFPCAQLPPDVIQTIGGLPIYIQGDTEERFAGKIIDLENGKLVVKDR